MIFERAGMLERFYTDSSNYSFLGKINNFISLKKGPFLRLKSRKIINIPKHKIYSSDLIFFNGLFKHKPSLREFNLWKHKAFSKKAIKWGLGHADAIYHMEIENIDFVRFAKEQNKIIITDMFISPITDKLLIEEQLKYPFLDSVNYSKKEVKGYLAKYKEIIQLSDLILCPSEWVAKGVLEVNPNVANKIRVVPYGSSISFIGLKNKPVKGRFLFVGTDGLRKGLPYLAIAATRLKQSYPDMDFRVAGLKKEDVECHNLFNDLNFLGKLSKSRLKLEYLKADAFILPTFSEGLAGVLIEAMSAGLPIITTKNSGVDIKDEVNALQIETGNVNDIIMAVMKIYNNRDLRDYLSKESIKNASEYTIESWTKRLLKVFEEFDK